jgi:hypothetical protein
MKISVTDCKPFFEQKDVILCRSGVQEYTYAEVLRMLPGTPAVRKDLYKVYRPASLLIEHVERFTSLPITKEHPSEFINGDNFKRFAEGYTGSSAEVVSVGMGEIGIKSSLVMSTSEIYNYYLSGNTEVSLGYESINEWVENPDTFGYDIIMTQILDINHCAITAAGRGGERVAIIDSLIGGLTMFKTGLFHWLKTKGKTSDSTTPFSKIVFDSVESAKNLDGAALEKEITKVMDSLATLKDGESKTLLMDTVTDLFKAQDTAIANKETVSTFLDTMYKKADEETVKQVKDNMETTKEESKKVSDSETEDTDGKGTSTSNISDSEKEAEEKETKEKEATEKKEVMDSVASLVQDAVASGIEKALGPAVDAAVSKALGLTSSKTPTGGPVNDSAPVDQNFDMSKFVL